MQLNKIAFFNLMFIISYLMMFTVYADDNTNASENKRIDLPFVHIGVNKHTDGQKDVDVRAPFVHVHNPAGANNAQVKAPFTKVEHGTASELKTDGNSSTKIKQHKTVTTNSQ